MKFIKKLKEGISEYFTKSEADTLESQLSAAETNLEIYKGIMEGLHDKYNEASLNHEENLDLTKGEGDHTSFLRTRVEEKFSEFEDNHLIKVADCMSNIQKSRDILSNIKEAIEKRASE